MHGTIDENSIACFVDKFAGSRRRCLVLNFIIIQWCKLCGLSVSDFLYVFGARWGVLEIEEY